MNNIRSPAEGSDFAFTYKLPRKKILTDSTQDSEKNDVKDEEKNAQKFQNLVHKSDTTLFKLSSVFPFDFFPDEISIDLCKVNIVNKNFLAGRVQSIEIRNVIDVIVDVSIFFASLRVVHVAFGENTIDVNYLKKHEAYRARKIIQGLAVATRRGVDVFQIETKDLLQKIESLGEMTQTTPA